MNHSFDIVVIGAGPAGLSAATAAARAGRRVAVLDENSQAGGQIWRAGITNSHPDPTKALVLARFQSSNATLFSGHQVIDADPSGRIETWVSATQTLHTFTAQHIILATGARERFLPFPGWTLPGVFGAGGLQALVRGGFNVCGKRIVVAGTGPLLLAVAAHLKQDGAEIVSIAEQAPLARLLPFSGKLLSRPAKLMQGLSLRMQLAATPYRTSCWPVAAEGDNHIQSVRLTNGSKTWSEPCDLLACGFHLVPNTELAMLLGCTVNDSGVTVDANQQTSIPNIYCVGEPIGIAGVDAAMLQGEIAGLAAAGRPQQATKLHPSRDAEITFGKAMDKAFALRPELRTLAAPDTIVCRCEDVRYAQAAEQNTPQGAWTDAKLQTRCGMGPCQGRICGPALDALFGWKNTSVRSPLFPIPIAALCSQPHSNDFNNSLTTQESA